MDESKLGETTPIPVRDHSLKITNNNDIKILIILVIVCVNVTHQNEI